MRHPTASDDTFVTHLFIKVKWLLVLPNTDIQIAGNRLNRNDDSVDDGDAGNDATDADNDSGDDDDSNDDDFSP